MKKKISKIAFNIVVGILILCGLFWIVTKFVHLGNVEFTDNAQVKQLIVPVNSRIQGFISKIYFEEYQSVKKGDTLAIIEDTEFRFKLAQAEADYQNALSGNSAMTTSISTTQNNIVVSDAGIREAKAKLDNAEHDYIRYKNLVEKEAVTMQQFDNVKTNYEATKARYEQLLHQKHSTALIKQEQSQRLGQTSAGIKLTEAALKLARLNLSYTVIIAPCDGMTGRKNIVEGQLIQPGQTIVDVVDDNNKWLIANYKETQTTHIRKGQEVEIEVDAVPGVKYKGTVKSISQATGANYSLLPQDNSAGNFIKVEQRIPIHVQISKENKRVDLDRLRSGMNAECTVKY